MGLRVSNHTADTRGSWWWYSLYAGLPLLRSENFRGLSDSAHFLTCFCTISSVAPSNNR